MSWLRLPGLVLVFASAPLCAEPFLTRDQNPLLGGFALPMPAPAEISSSNTSHVDLVANWSSTASSGLTPGEALLVDLESREVRALIEHSFNERYSLRLQIPYRQLGAGVLDGFIDGWHQVLGLPEGARKFLERNQFQVGYLRGGQTLINLREPVRGFGDVVVEGGYQLRRKSDSAVALWLTLEAPTGDEQDLLGNGAWDAAVQLAGRNTLSSRSTVYWQVASAYLGTSRYLSAWQKHWAVSASGTFEYAAWRSLHLKAQVDAHSALYKSDVDFLGNAVILSVGGDYRFASGLILNVGIGEDIEVGSSPDVNFILALSRSF
jgi:Protein of unknown function (DUF3187)